MARRFTRLQYYANFASFPAAGGDATMYVDKATNTIYRWDGATYVAIGGGGGGGGDVTGPASATDNAIAIYDGITGKIIKNSLATIDGSGNLTANNFSGSSTGSNTGDQNLFSTIAVAGQSNVVADGPSDTLTLVAGTNVTITTNAGTDSITINASGGGLTWGTSISSGSGTGIAMTTADLAGDKPFITMVHTASGTLTANTTTQESVITDRTYALTSGSVTDNFVGSLFSRVNTTTGAGGTLLSQGSVVSITGSDTQTAGTLTSSYSLLNLMPSLRCSGSAININARNSLAVAPTNGHIYVVVGNTQSVGQTAINVDMGTSTVTNIGVNVNSTYNAIVSAYQAYCYNSTTQSTATGVGVGYGFAYGTNASFNTNSTVNAVGFYGYNTNNAGSGKNTGLHIENFSTEYTVGTSSKDSGAGIHVYQGGAAGTAYSLATANNINSSTNGLVNYTLANTQSGATVMQKIDLGTSAQAHVGLLVNAFGASTTQYGINVDKSSTGTGKGIIVTSSLATSTVQEDIIGIEHTNAGDVGRAFFYAKDSSGQSSGKIINANIGFRFLTSGETNNGYIDIDNPRGPRLSNTVGYLVSGNKTGNGGTNAPTLALYTSVVYVATEHTATAPMIWIDASTSTNKMPLTRGMVMDMVVSSSVVTNPLVSDFSQTTRQRTNTHTSSTLAENFNLQYFKRTSIQNGAGGTFTSTGAVVKIENVATQTAGTLTDTTDVLNLTQGVTTTGAMIKMVCGNTSSKAFEFATNLTTGSAPAGASTYINVSINGVAHRILAQAV